MTKKSIYLSSIIKRLARENSQHCESATFISPYLTSKTAEEIITRFEPESSDIYTVFTLENFASGASSINTVSKLMSSGHRVFHIPELHAKMVIAKNFATIGSQNLTRGGSKNKEASYVTTDSKDIQKIEEGLAGWFEQRVLITDQHVKVYREALPEFRKKYLKIKNEIAQAELNAENTIDALITKRAEEASHKKKIIKSRIENIRKRSRMVSKRLARIRTHIQNSSPSQQIKSVRLSHVLPGNQAPEYWTLKKRNSYDDSLLYWSTHDQEFHLKKSRRYLMVNIQTGFLSWPALNNTQITRFGGGVTWNHGILDITNLDETSKFEFIWAEDGVRDHNIVIDAKVNAIGLHLHIEAEFDINSVQITKLENLSERVSGDSLFAKEIRELIDKPSILEGRITNKILSDFKYEYNSIGGSPRKYLDSSSAKNYWVALFDYQSSESPFLVISDNYDELYEMREEHLLALEPT